MILSARAGRAAFLAVIAALALAHPAYTEKASGADDEAIRRLQTLFGETDERPTLAGTNREDVIYHDIDLPAAVATTPEFWVFGPRAWVFNRSMQWYRDETNGPILCYSPVDELLLTGQRQVSAWHSGPANALEQEGNWTIFQKRSALRREAAVLPAFQFHLGQHPKVEVEVAEASCDWQFCVSIKGRGGPPLVASPWHRGSARLAVNLEEELRRRGYGLQFPELHFVIGTWSAQPHTSAAVRFRVWMPSRAAVVACLPVIRTAAQAAKDGVPLTALVVDELGRRVGADRTHVLAEVAGKAIPLAESQGIWRATLAGLGPGNHEVAIRSEGAATYPTRALVRVTDGQFLSYDKSARWLTRDGKPLGPLSGSFQGSFYFRDAGLPSERMVQGQAEWDCWNRAQLPGEHMHYWEALTPRELDQRFAYLAACGWDTLALHSHWGLWEKLDAGGRISPHAAEQLALYLRTAARHGLLHIQALSSGPYGEPRAPSRELNFVYGQTPPWDPYFAAGFKTRHWFEPGAAFDALFERYLQDFVTLFREETALLGMTASGEGDAWSGLSRTRKSFRFVRSLDDRHVFLSEPLVVLKKLPPKYCAGWEQDMHGGRTYLCAKDIPAANDLSLEFKLYNLAGAYMAEGCWPPMPAYHRLYAEVLSVFGRPPFGNFQHCWTGTALYRMRVRDTLYLGLVHRLPLLNTWDEQMTEDEHLVFGEVRRQVDWSQRFAEPAVVVLVDDACASIGNAARANLARYEEAFASLPLAYRLHSAEEAPPKAVAVLDARRPFSPLRFQSQQGVLPDELRQSMPLEISPGYRACYAWSADRRTLLAYVYNGGQSLRQEILYGGDQHRTPRPADLDLRVRNLPGVTLRYRLYDLDMKKACREIVAAQPPHWPLGITDHDYFLLVTPK